MLSIISLFVVGLVVGAIARLAMPGRQSMGWIATALLGIGGALVGGLGGQALGIYQVGEPVGWIGAVIGALILLFLYGKMRPSS